tara:strand:- start:3476 stop:4048 length:573 start_codon:yes stop_codon:yes gene_type:complete
MLEAAKEAISDRIKTPIIGTYLLFFTFVNYLQFHPLIVNFKSIEKTQEAYGSLDISFSVPAGYTLVYILISTLIKIANKTLDAGVEMVIDSIHEKVSERQRNDNLRKINTLNKDLDEVYNRITSATSFFNTGREHIFEIVRALKLNVKETSSENTRTQDQLNNRDKVIIEEHARNSLNSILEGLKNLGQH